MRNEIKIICDRAEVHHYSTTQVEVVLTRPNRFDLLTEFSQEELLEHIDEDMAREHFGFVRDTE